MQIDRLQCRISDLERREAWARAKGLNDIAHRLSLIRSDYERQLRRHAFLIAEGLPQSLPHAS